MNLNEIERRKIAEAINENLEAYCSNFDSLKYPEEPYIKWKKAFANPCVDNKNFLKEAFEWKYGHWGKDNYPESHKTIISKFCNNWEEFVEKNKFDMKDIFDYWEKVLKDHQNFVTIAFITHLIHSENIPLIDQNTFRSMNYILKKVKNNSFSENKPSCIDDLKEYTDFFNSIVPLINADGDKRR
ncbi:MAG: hypothetical protein GF317_13100, partial [Candidatus Lokiarchaeota archaeon]|nr:hypothetical protein [Candidatus Lokiarchaeota archaeon]